MLKKLHMLIARTIITFGIQIAPKQMKIYFIEMMSNYSWILDELAKGNDLYLTSEDLPTPKPNFKLIKNEEE